MDRYSVIFQYDVHIGNDEKKFIYLDSAYVNLYYIHLVSNQLIK